MDKYLTFQFNDRAVKAIVVAVPSDNSSQQGSFEQYAYEKEIPEHLCDNALGADFENKNFYNQWLKSELDSAEELSELTEFRETLVAELNDFLVDHRSDLVGNLMIIPARKYMSLVIELPFSDRKIIDRVIRQEVQDKVPFDLEGFQVTYKLISKETDTVKQIHVGICPEYIISFCRDLANSLQINLQHVCTKADLVTYQEDHGCEYQVKISEDDNSIYLKAFVAGKSVGVNVVNKKNLRNQDAFIKGLMAYYQKQFSSEFELIKSDSESDIREAANLLSADKIDFLSDFGNRNYLLTNFVKFLQKTLYRCRCFLAAAVVLLVIYPLVQVGINNYLIDQTKEAISKNLIERIPQLSFPPEKELDYLITQNSIITQQLEKLGNPSNNNPFDVYAVVAEVLDKATGASTQMDLQELKIESDEIVFSGTVPIYKGVDRIERLLKSRENLFCQISKETPGSSGSNTRFIFKLRLCA